jgi:fatty-acyl-CoA synthase
MSLLAGLEAAAALPARVCFTTPSSSVTISTAELWERAADVAVSLGRADVPVAVVLDNSPEAVTAVLGTLRSGRDLVSLPLPARSDDPSSYLEQSHRLAGVAEAEQVAVADEWLAFFDGASGAERLVGLSSLTVGGSGGPADDGSSAVVQHTSGTTGDPSGVTVSQDRLAASCEAICATLEPGSSAVMASWLPLSHDMGLVGGLLTSWWAAGTGRSSSGTLALARPEDFVRSPGWWIGQLEHFSASITAMPPAGLDALSRLLRAHVVRISHRWRRRSSVRR